MHLTTPLHRFWTETCRYCAALLVTLGAFTSAALAANDQTLTDPTGSTGDAFSLVGAHGTRLVVGAPGDDDQGVDAGSIREYDEGTNGFAAGARLFGSSVGPGDRFGAAVAVDGDLMVAGAPQDDDQGLDAGAAYVFRRSGGSWVEEAKVTAATGVPDAYFGHAVAISGDVMIIGAYHVGNGTAHVFRRVAQGEWVEEATLSSSAGLYGFAVAAAGDRVAVGGFETVEVFRAQGTSWVLEAALTSPAGTGGIFGNSVAMDGDRLVVGSWLDGAVASNAGAVYVYHRMGTSWVYDDVLRAADAAQGDFFGGAVAVVQDRILVGAHGDDDAGEASGSAYLFEMVSGAWLQQQKLVATGGNPWDGHGGSVAVTATAAIVGASNGDGLAVDSGAAYVTCLTPPIGALLDVVPGRTTAHYAAPGLIDVVLDYSVLLGGDVHTPGVSFDVEVFVNGTSVETQTVTEFISLGIPACYSSAVPCVAGGCPGAVRCEWVDLPGTLFDYCACDWIGSIVITVPGQLGDQVALVVDANNDVDETREGNNTAAFVAGDMGGTFCTSAPNSTGEAASIAAFGSAFVGQNEFALQAAGLPAGAASIFIVSTAPSASPLGNGTLCLGGSILRVIPPVVAGPAGFASQALDLTQAPWLGRLAPGTTWRFQNWHRDGGSPFGFNLTDATAVEFAAEGQLESPSTIEEPTLRDPLAQVSGPPIDTVAGMIGTQTFVRTPEFGRMLVTIEAIELYVDSNGSLQLGFLEGPMELGDAEIEGIVIDRRADALAFGWTELTSLTNFHTGITGSNADLFVDSVSFRRIATNGYEVLTLGELHGFDYASDVQVDQLAAGVDCNSVWEWRCANTACGGGCTYYEEMPNGRVEAACDCKIGFCNWVYLPRCLRVNCSGACTLTGVWDFCDC